MRLFDGREISQLPPQDIVGLGICQSPEGRGIFPNLTVTENLRYFATVVGVRRRDLHDALAGDVAAEADGVCGGRAAELRQAGQAVPGEECVTA